jgi:hypothetical protein
MTDLFISYSSHDRPWAEQLFKDFQRRFPTINVFWDRNPASIPPGEPYRQYFENGARDTDHFVVFWSAAALASSEVNPEIQAFLQNVQNKPTTATNTKRRPFYVQLQHDVAYGPLTTYQGFPDFQKAYEDYALQNPGTPNHGIDHLDAQASLNWDRMVRTIAGTVVKGRASQAVTLALVVMTNATQAFANPTLSLRGARYPTLSQFLTSVGLTVPAAQARYGATPFEWRPFGSTKTIIDLMEDVRETAIKNLGETYRFNWEPIDFVQEWTAAPDEAADRKLMQSLLDKPSVVITDPISLFDLHVKRVFEDLEDYAKRQQSIILSISPNEQLSIEPLYQTLHGNSPKILRDQLYPPIPAAETFALCGMNIQHSLEIERFIRIGLGYFHLQKKKAALQPLVSAGV